MAESRPVLIVSTLAEPSVDRVTGHLDRMGVPWHRLNCEDFPLLRMIDVSIGRGEQAVRMSDAAGVTFALDEIRSRWFRRFSAPALPTYLSPNDRQFAEGEVSATLLGSILGGDGFAVNQRDAERRASNKLVQLQTAVTLGFDIPETLITNDPQRARAFAERLDGAVIFKPVSGVAPRAPDLARHVPERFAEWGEVSNSTLPARAETEAVFAQMLDAEKLEHIDGIRLAPVTFQRFVPKVADVRVTVVGREIFACRILSQDHHETRVDFRRMALMGAASQDIVHEAIDLPAPLGSAILRLMDALGLVFGCLDFVEGADGAMTFLEVNPSGQWLWVEARTGQPISERLAQVLAAGRA